MSDYDDIYFTLITGIIVFSLLIGHASITGYATLPGPDELRNQVADFVNKVPPSVLVKKASSCIVIEENGYQSYEVNKSGSELFVTRRYCAEDSDKDLIIKFNGYDAFLNTKDNPDSLFENHGKDFWLFKSAKLGSGGTPVCDEDFRTKFCAASYYYLTKSQMETQLSCCADYELTEEEQQILDQLRSARKKLLSPKSIADVGLLVIVFSLTAVGLLVTTFVVLHSRAKKRMKSAKVEELKGYVTQSLQSGFSSQQIRETLTSAGWKQEDIEEAFK